MALARAVDRFSTVSDDGVEVVGDKTSDVVTTVESTGIGTTGSFVDDPATAVDDCFVVCATTRGSLDTGTGLATVDSIGSALTDSGTLGLDDGELVGMLAAVSDIEELSTAIAVELAGVTGISSDDTVELAAVSLVVVALVVGVSSADVFSEDVRATRGVVEVSSDNDVEVFSDNDVEVSSDNVVEVSSDNDVEVAASVLTADVGASRDVEAGAELPSTDEESVSEDNAARVVLMALEGRMTASGLLSAALSGVLSVVLSTVGLSRRSMVSVVDVVVGVGVGDSIVIG